jgi:hypothetical protein
MVIALIPILGWVIVIILSVYPACVCGFLFWATYSKAIIAAGDPASAFQDAINSAAEQAASKELTFCSSCGARLNAGELFCKICGNKIE